MIDNGSDFVTLVYWYDLNRLHREARNASNLFRPKAIPE